MRYAEHNPENEYPPHERSGHRRGRPHGRRRGGPGRGHGHGRGRGGRAGRGDLRSVVLVLLAEEPMHGYQLITEITGRTNEQWAPSPGAIYPTLNLLEDEGLVTITKESGRKLATLTTEGHTLVADNPGWAGLLESYAHPVDPQDPAFRRRGAMHRLRNAVKARGEADNEKVVEILNRAAEDIENL